MEHDGTWLTGTSRHTTCVRVLLLAATFCGLIPCPLLISTGTVRHLVTEMGDLFRLMHSRGGGRFSHASGTSEESSRCRGLMGVAAVLCLQVFVPYAMSMVCEVAAHVFRRGGGWKTADLRGLLRRLERCDPKLAGKRRGRQAMYSGPRWLRTLLSVPTGPATLVEVGRLLGQLLSRSPPSYAELAGALESNALPGVGRYGRACILRATIVAFRPLRQQSVASAVAGPLEEDCPVIRGMNAAITSETFQASQTGTNMVVAQHS